jgi:hypothetical protein
MEESVIKGFQASVILFGGYLFLRTSYYRHFLTEHLRADRFAFHLLGYALLSYFISVVVVSIIARQFPDSLVREALATASEYTHLESPVVCTLFIASILGIADSLLTLFLMRRNPSLTKTPWLRQPLRILRAAAQARFIRNCDDHTIRLLHRAHCFRKPVMVTMRNRKVYVGELLGIGNPSVTPKSIKIFPRFSGYRKRVTQKVELPTDYEKIYAKVGLRNEGEPANPDDPLSKDLGDLVLDSGKKVEVDIQDMGIVILWSQIQTLSLYDKSIYQAFQAVGPPLPKTPRRSFLERVVMAMIK